MKYFGKAISVLIAIALVFSGQAYANSLGVTYGSGFGSHAFSLTGDYEVGILEVEGTATLSDNFRAKIEPALRGEIFSNETLSVSGRVFSVNTFKGETYRDAGRVNDLGADGIVTIWGTDVSVGFFGRDGNPYAPVSATQFLVDGGYGEDAVGTGTPPQRGLTVKEGQSFGAAVGFETTWSGFEVGARGLIELFGEGPRADQLAVDLSTGGYIGWGISWTAALEVETQWYDGNVEYENAVFIGGSIEL